MLCVFLLLHWLAIPCLLSSPQAFLVPGTQEHEIRLINNPTVTSKCPSERRVTCLSLKAKIKLNEKGTLNAKIGWKLGLLHQLAKLWKQIYVLKGN